MEKETMEVTLHLRMYPEDFKYLRRKAISGGLEFEELFEIFAGDLAAGDAQSGSDESDLAWEWYDRHGFEVIADMNFVRYLSESGYDLEDVFDELRTVDIYLNYLLTDEGEERDIDMEEIQYSILSLKEFYEDYCRETKELHNYREALQALWKYGNDELRFRENIELHFRTENFWDKLYDLWEQMEENKWENNIIS